MPMTLDRLARLGVLAATLLLTACGGNNNNFFIQSGTIRFVNAISDSLPLDVSLQSQGFARVPFAAASAPTSVTATTLRLDVVYLNSAGVSTGLISNESVTVGVDKNLSVYLTGTVATPRTVIVESTPLELAAGRGQVSLINVANNGANLELFLTDPATDITTATPTATLAFRANAAARDVPTGNYRLRVRAVGNPAVLFDSGTFAITDQARAVYAVIDYFGPGTTPVRVVRIDNTGTSLFPTEVLPAAVRVANLVADSLDVDATFDDGVAPLSIADVPFPGVSDRITTRAAQYTAQVIADDDPGAVVLQAAQTFVPGESRTLVLFGTAASGYQSRYVLDSVRPVAGEANVRVIHAAPVAASVDFYLVASGTTIDSATPRFTALPTLTAGSLFLAPGTYDVVFTTPTTKDIVAGPAAMTVAARSFSTIYSHDAIGGGAPADILIQQVTP